MVDASTERAMAGYASATGSSFRHRDGADHRGMDAAAIWNAAGLRKGDDELVALVLKTRVEGVAVVRCDRVRDTRVLPVPLDGLAHLDGHVVRNKAAESVRIGDDVGCQRRRCRACPFDGAPGLVRGPIAARGHSSTACRERQSNAEGHDGGFPPVHDYAALCAWSGRLEAIAVDAGTLRRTRKRPSSSQAIAIPSGTMSSSTGMAVVRSRPGMIAGNPSPISIPMDKVSPAAASPASAETSATGASYPCWAPSRPEKRRLPISTAPISRMAPTRSSVTSMSPAKRPIWGRTNTCTSDDRIPRVAPGVERTKALKLATYWGSASLFKPDRVNSSPSA